MTEGQQPLRPTPPPTLLGRLGLSSRAGRWFAIGFGALFASVLLGRVTEGSLAMRVVLLLLGLALLGAWAAPRLSSSAPSVLRALLPHTRYVWLAAGVLAVGSGFGFIFVASTTRQAEERRQRAELDAQVASAQRRADVEAATEARARFENAVTAFAGNETKIGEALAAIEKAVPQRPTEARGAFDEAAKFFTALDAATNEAQKAAAKLPDAGAIDLPPNVVGLRRRFETARAALEKRESEVFDAVYTALWPPDADPGKWADQMGAVDDSAGMTGPAVQKYRAVVAAVAGKLGLSVAETKAVFLRIQGTGELDRRLEARKKQNKDALDARCGPEPKRSLSGGQFDVESYLKEKAHDPESVEVTNCTEPRMTPACWVSECNVRAKNQFGAKVLHRMRFTLVANPEEAFRNLVAKVEQL
jgi:hypothetical protein